MRRPVQDLEAVGAIDGRRRVNQPNRPVSLRCDELPPGSAHSGSLLPPTGCGRRGTRIRGVVPDLRAHAAPPTPTDGAAAAGECVVRHLAAEGQRASAGQVRMTRPRALCRPGQAGRYESAQRNNHKRAHPVSHARKPITDGSVVNAFFGDREPRRRRELRIMGPLCSGGPVGCSLSRSSKPRRGRRSLLRGAG